MEVKFAVQVLDFRFRKWVQNFRNLTEKSLSFPHLVSVERLW